MAKKASQHAKKGAPKDTSAEVTVRALVNLHENDTHLAPGDEFITTADRAKALGDTVELVTPAK